MNELFPIFLKADQLNILLVGGGEVAAEKLYFLLKSSPKANVHLVTKELSPAVKQLIFNYNVSVEIRPYQEQDLLGKHLVLAATANEVLNQEIRKDAVRNGVLLNIADKSDLCDFYLGGVVTKGDLKLAISTNGKSPVMAKRLRQFFEAHLPYSLDDLIKNLSLLRKQLNGNFSSKVNQLNKITKDLVRN